MTKKFFGIMYVFEKDKEAEIAEAIKKHSECKRVLVSVDTAEILPDRICGKKVEPSKFVERHHFVLELRGEDDDK